MKPSLRAALLLAASGVHSTTAWVVFPPSYTTSSSSTATALRSTPYNDGNEASPDQPLQQVEDGPPRIQPIQPGMSEPALYANPPASMSIAPNEETDQSGGIQRTNDRSYGFRTYNDQAANMMQSTNNQLDERRKRPLLPELGAERIQGNSLRTYSSTPGSTQTSIGLTSQGRPMNADLEFWSGPDNTPQSVRLYSQDGSEYGVSTTFNSGSSQQTSSVSIRNDATMEFPLTARVSSNVGPQGRGAAGGVSSVGQVQQAQRQQPRALELEGGVLLQGEGMVRTFPIAANVQKVQILLQSSATTTGRRLPVYAKVELLQGPNNVKTTAEIYDDGLHGEYFETVFDTPGFTSSLRITNTGPMTYPFHVLVLPHTFGDPKPSSKDYNDITASRFGPDGQFRG